MTSLMIVGCGEKERRESASKMEVKNDLVYIAGETKPYTGVLFVTEENDQISEEGTYKNGKLNGTRKEWYPDGQLKCIESYRNNVKHGIWNTWFFGGDLAIEEVYKNGNKDGLCRIWSPKGFVTFEGTFKNDLGNGVFKQWDDEGNLESEALYKDGQLVEVLD